MTLKKYLCAGKKHPVKASIARLADFLKLPFWKAQRIVYGIAIPTTEQDRKIETFIAKKTPLVRKKWTASGRFSKKRNGVERTQLKGLRKT